LRYQAHSIALPEKIERATPSELGIAEQAGAAPLDIEGSFWSDRDHKTTFDVMLGEFGLETEPLLHLALIIRRADTGQLDRTPQSARVLAACLGYFRMYRDDLVQLAAAMAHFDAVHRWSRDATDERHGRRPSFTPYLQPGILPMTNAVPLDLSNLPTVT
jgi:hypothetical protein